MGAPGHVFEQAAQALRLGHGRTLAVGPMGGCQRQMARSRTIFLDRMEATICPGESSDNGRSTEISTSSAGDRCAVPPRPGSRGGAHNACCNWSDGQFDLGQHFHSVGGAGRGGDGARGGLGQIMPWAATMGTMSMEVRFGYAAANTVLVDHQAFVPVQAFAGGDHGFGEGSRPLFGRFVAVAGRHECGDSILE